MLYKSIFCFTKLSIDLQRLRALVFYYRAYLKTRKPRKILISLFSLVEIVTFVIPA